MQQQDVDAFAKHETYVTVNVSDVMGFLLVYGRIVSAIYLST